MNRYVVDLGGAFDQHKREESDYHFIRYNFIPNSVDDSANAILDISENGTVQMNIPRRDHSTTNFTGNVQKVPEKEFLLILDPRTKKATLNRVNDSYRLSFEPPEIEPQPEQEPLKQSIDNEQQPSLEFEDELDEENDEDGTDENFEERRKRNLDDINNLVSPKLSDLPTTTTKQKNKNLSTNSIQSSFTTTTTSTTTTTNVVGGKKKKKSKIDSFRAKYSKTQPRLKVMSTTDELNQFPILEKNLVNKETKLTSGKHVRTLSESSNE
ncbi:hypothetical protein SNEBB_001404 [Seison nebaliae]|nr:hypothetical protein SNEBB_001404 [Seison nebaliae]